MAHTYEKRNDDSPNQGIFMKIWIVLGMIIVKMGLLISDISLLF